MYVYVSISFKPGVFAKINHELWCYTIFNYNSKLLKS